MRRQRNSSEFRRSEFDGESPLVPQNSYEFCYVVTDSSS